MCSVRQKPSCVEIFIIFRSVEVVSNIRPASTIFMKVSYHIDISTNQIVPLFEYFLNYPRNIKISFMLHLQFFVQYVS